METCPPPTAPRGGTHLESERAGGSEQDDDAAEGAQAHRTGSSRRQGHLCPDYDQLVCADDSGFTEIGVRLAVSCSEREQSGPLANFLI